jgi:endonuclease YncB( thermonuclease family)
VKGIDCPESSRDVDKCWSDDDLIDIPCPEQVPLGKRATEYAEDALAGKTVRLESYDGFKEGGYGRTLAYIRTPDGKDYSLKTIKRGLCKDSGVRYDHPRDDQYEPHRRPIDR